jgi:glycosyltransferase involved in cell wall biosynthesis
MKLPSVSVVFLSYKQERFVEEALRAALAQDLPEFELIIADDASPDGTWAVIDRVLAEPLRPGIRVKTLRQPKNLGILGNFNAALAMASGEVFVLMAGDDVSYPSRVRKMAEAFAADPMLRAVTCANRLVDAAGKALPSRPPDLRTQVFEHGRGRKDPFAGSPVTGACASYHRSLYDVFGPLPPDAGGEDIDSIFRALLLGPVKYYGEVLLDYRMHGGNICNFEMKELSDEELLRKQTRDSDALSRCDTQWLRDLDVAFKGGFIDERRRAQIAWLVERFVSRHALSALSLKQAPFSLWWPAAWRLLRRGDFVKVAKLFHKRVSQARRNAHLKWARGRKG